MILDAQMLFSDAQAVTTDAVGTNVIDLGISRPLAVGEPMGVLFTIDVAADQTTGDEDYTFDVEYASDAGQTTARQLVGRAVFESGTPGAPALDADLLVAGFQFVIPVMSAKAGIQNQFLGIRYDTTGTTPTITVTAALMPLSMIQNDVLYADAITIQ